MDAWAPGFRLGPYELIAPLGSGGMGEVWKAHDERLHRTVAIKRLKTDHAERFKREARTIAALNHPHICQLYDIGPDYLVMEYVHGKAVKGPLSCRRCIAMASQIADALVAAHRQGIVHRDLKPANIVLSESGAKLLDFGLARVESLLASTEETVGDAFNERGAVVGTLSYMSPEQAQGLSIDARSDVFSFGALLYEVLSGRRAFAGETAFATLSAVVNDTPPSLDAPAALVEIVTRCLAKQPSDRFQSMTDVAAALARIPYGSRDTHPSIAVLPFANEPRLR